MSTTDLWTVIGRAKSDPDFQARLFPHFEQTIQQEGYKLSESEIAQAKQALNDMPPLMSPAAPMPLPFPPPMPLIPEKMILERFEIETQIGKQRIEQQLKRNIDLGEFTVDILKKTIHSASATFKTVTWMNTIMFSVGIGLFVFAAFYAAFSHEKIYSLIFGGLGAATFVSLFILRPTEQSQNALSNLVQVEISFMNFFEQITLWEGYALTPQGNPPLPNPANIERASEMLQKRAAETINVLQKYVEIHATPNPN